MSDLFTIQNSQSFAEVNGLQNSLLVKMHDNKVVSGPPAIFLTLDEVITRLFSCIFLSNRSELQIDNSLKDHVFMSDVHIDEKPLGSSENPIEIIQDGEILRTTQNLSKTHLELIANALQSENNTVKVESDTDPITSNFVYRVVYPEELNLKVSEVKSVLDV